MTTDRTVLSIDFELFRHTPAYRNAAGNVADESLGLSAWPFLEQLLDEHEATATFFVVGELAEEHPEVVSSIAAAGHEVASHTQTHRLLSDVPPAERAPELAESRSVLESVTGQAVDGFRAPAFDRPPGFFSLLEETGYTYDSSVVPARRIPGWYGGDCAETDPCSASDVVADAPPLGELPVSVMPRVRLPISGAWMRLLGRRYAMAGVRTLHRHEKIPVLYTHPWELVDLPSVAGVPRRVTWRTGQWMRDSLRQILELDCEFVTARSAVEAGYT